jgi:hypothetical protein
LQAFTGFLLEDFREHDFQLGRFNCQSFLKNSFKLPKENALFGGTGSADADAEGMLPIIPLVGNAKTDLQPPVWPKDRFNIESIHDPLKARLKGVVANIAAPLLQNVGLVKEFFVEQVIDGATDTGFDLLQQAILDALKDAYLLKP